MDTAPSACYMGAMTPELFIETCSKDSPPRALSNVLEALWHDRKGEWEKAHEAVQHEGDRGSAAVHAYLHRKEGDLWNARYWYNNAGKKPFNGSLDEEWEALVREFLVLR